MRCSKIRFAALSSLMVACGAGSSAGPGLAGPETTIHMTADAAPALVVFRDAADGTWRPATRTSATTFDAVVRGTYMITAVCDLGTGGGLKGIWQTYQIGRSLEDPPEIPLGCAGFTAPPVRKLTGTMMQVGRVSAGGASQLSQTPSWSFQLPAYDGPYELYAMTPDRIVVRRGVVAGDTLVTPAIDLTTEGAALEDVSFTVTNLEPGDRAEVSVGIETDETSGIAEYFRGDITDAKIAPDSVLVAPDLQTVLIRAIDTQPDTTEYYRGLRRSFHVGGDTSYTLPDRIGAPRWSLDNENLSVTWSSAPDGFPASLDAGGATRDPNRDAYYAVDLSPRYLAETGVTGAATDLDIPGFQPAWRLDFTKQYSRDIGFFTPVDPGGYAESFLFETVNQGNSAGLGAGTAPRTRPTRSSTARRRGP